MVTFLMLNNNIGNTIMHCFEYENRLNGTIWRFTVTQVWKIDHLNSSTFMVGNKQKFILLT